MAKKSGRVNAELLEFDVSPLKHTTPKERLKPPTIDWVKFVSTLTHSNPQEWLRGKSLKSFTPRVVKDVILVHPRKELKATISFVIDMVHLKIEDHYGHMVMKWQGNRRNSALLKYRLELK